MNSEVEFFYCYDSKLAKYLRYDREVKFICNAIHPKTNKMFWQFIRSDKLNEYISNFMESNKGG
jgi:hypothetical protein